MSDKSLGLLCNHACIEVLFNIYSLYSLQILYIVFCGWYHSMYTVHKHCLLKVLMSLRQKTTFFQHLFPEEKNSVEIEKCAHRKWKICSIALQNILNITMALSCIIVKWIYGTHLRAENNKNFCFRPILFLGFVSRRRLTQLRSNDSSIKVSTWPHQSCSITSAWSVGKYSRLCKVTQTVKSTT